jgi:hypothetical protein
LNGTEMPSSDDVEIMLDFGTVQRSADRVRDMLVDLRSRFDLSPFEYTKRIRIAPLEIPHSHPTLTLNSWVPDGRGPRSAYGDLHLLSSYLHEQMHWYVTWYSHARPDCWGQLFQALHARYPKVPPDAAPDEFAIYLHLIINWLEIEVTAQFVDRDRVVAGAAALPFYRWIYRTVIEDWTPLADLYDHHGLLPLRHATDMSPEELQIAALATEAPT